MAEVGNKVVVYSKERIPALRERLRKRKSPQVVVIDSIPRFVGFTRSTLASLMDEFPTNFSSSSPTRNGKPYPAVVAARHVRKLAEVKIRVRVSRHTPTTRFATAEGGGGEEFVIWPEGAAKYYAFNNRQETKP